MYEFRKRQSTGAIMVRFFALWQQVLSTLFLLSVVVVRAAWGMYGTFQIAVDARDNAEGQLASLTVDQARAQC
jgi:hypothetical protein